MKKIILIYLLFFSSCITVNINNCECECEHTEKAKEEEIRAVPGLDAKRKLNVEPQLDSF